jgi:hypothetical protein
MSVCLCEQKRGWAKEAIHKRLKDLLPPNIKIRQENLMVAEDQPDEDLDVYIKYIHLSCKYSKMSVRLCGTLIKTIRVS